MKIKQRSYPHPVLSFFNDDYLESTFDLHLSFASEGTNKYINYEFILTDESLKRFISEKKANYMLHIECGKTLFRECIEVSHKGEIPVDVEKLDGKVEITGFVCSKENIANYSSENLHSDYREFSISIGQNNTLAVTQDKAITINRNNKCIGRPEDIFVVDSRKDKGETIQIKESDTQIIILMPEKIYKQYKIISDKSDNINLCCLLMPVIVKILCEIKYNGNFYEEVKDNSWFVAFENCSRELGVELSDKTFDPYEMAQEILKKPYFSGLKKLINLYERDDNGNS